MQNKKKMLTLAIAGVIAVSAIGYGTLAYFTDTDAKNNVITMGNVDIDLEEPNYPGKDNDGVIEDIMPNQTIVKDPTITLDENSNDAYVRANIKISALKEGANFALTSEEIADLFATINIDKTTWHIDYANAATGEYVVYFKDILTQDNSPVKVFTEVTIPAKWGNKFSNVSIKLDVTAEAVQSDNFTPVVVDGMITSWGDVTVE